MLKESRGEIRSADTVGCAVAVARIATGEIEEILDDPLKRQPGRAGSGKVGGEARGFPDAGAPKPDLRRRSGRASGEMTATSKP